MAMSLQELTDNITVIDSPINGRTGALATYLIEGEQCAVIDPGPTSQTLGVLDTLLRLDVELEAVLATHIHLDHAGGSWVLLEEYPEAYLHCHPKGAPHMIDPSRLREGAERLFGDRILEYGKITGVKAERINESIDREVIDFVGIQLEVYWTPGHSSHSQSYFEPDSRTVFVGDAVGHTIGSGGPIIPVSPPPHNPKQALESIELIKSLRPENLCIAHFGAHRDPDKYLDRIKQRTILWNKLADKGVEEGLKLDGIMEMVLDEDQELSDHINGVEGAKHSVKASILGFYMYAKWVNDQKSN